MSKRTRGNFTEDFRREAVRLTQTSGWTIRQVAENLGIGLSTLTWWKWEPHATAPPAPQIYAPPHLSAFTQGGGIGLGDLCFLIVIIIL